MAPYHRIYRIALVLLLAAFSGCGGNEAPDISAAAATERKEGDDFRDRRDLDTAIACYTEAIQLEPNYTLACTDRGLALTPLPRATHATPRGIKFPISPNPIWNNS